jgi:hypothetical protein
MKKLAYGTIQAIKKNDCLNEQLTELEKILDQIYDRYAERNSQTYRKCVFPVDEEGEMMDPDEFFEMIYQFIEKSQLKLKNDSAKLLTD